MPRALAKFAGSKAAGWQLLCRDGELRAAWRSVSWAVRKGDVLALRLTAAAFTDAEFARAVFRFLLPADAAEHYNGTVQARAWSDTESGSDSESDPDVADFLRARRRALAALRNENP